MYSEVFCRVYNELGWNYYPEAFGQQLLAWMQEQAFRPKNSLDLACGTGILCQLLHSRGIAVRGMDLSQGMIAVARDNCPEIPYDIGDMVSYVPPEPVELVTCTGDAFNHIPALTALWTCFWNIHRYLAPGGWLIFDLLKESEISGSEPFEMDFDEHIHVWFQMTRPEEKTVNLCVKVWEDGAFRLEENIRESLHDPAAVREMLEKCGFRNIRCSDRLLPSQNKSSTWYFTAQK